MLPATPDVVAVFASDQATGGGQQSVGVLRRSVIIIVLRDTLRRQHCPVPGGLPRGSTVRAEHGGAKQRKAPADATALLNMLVAIEGDDLRAMRDRAILAIGMAAALRPSEIVAFAADHVGIVPEGLRLMIARSKIDQADQDTTIFKLQEVSHDKSVQVLSDYVRNAELSKDHAGQQFL